MEAPWVFWLFLLPLVTAYDFPGRLTIDEAAALQGSCGRLPPTKLDFNVTARPKRSTLSKLVNRTMAPWAVLTGGCSGVLISKRHVLTSAHCRGGGAPIFGDPSRIRTDSTVQFPMTCTANGKCSDLHYNISDILYLEEYLVGPQRWSGDVAIFVLAKDVEFSESIYPACIAGYSTDKNDTLEQFGYGASPDVEGPNRFGRLQTFTAKRDLELFWSKDIVYLKGIVPGSGQLGGDSGSSYIHTRNGVHSLYSLATSGYIRPMLTVRMSAHLYFISQVTGINVADEDEEFDGFFFRLIYKDKRAKKTYESGAKHPSKIIAEKTMLEHVLNRMANSKLCPEDVYTWLDPLWNRPVSGVTIFTRCKLYDNYFLPCSEYTSQYVNCQGVVNADVKELFEYRMKIISENSIMSPTGFNRIYGLTQSEYDSQFRNRTYPICFEKLEENYNMPGGPSYCIVKKYNR